ncbi:TetR family transcriptional regulator [Herbiconiux daphne]|uniref:TetR family transcriptional regulator n=1 Tax=Herbiconiux daphne TaxID=2970914 RepID=A0ABT2H705_9MICO|nr:TetR family transcriptional regulator [Herbiconiux daphne]MCS5735707.1 TetR family transcriptional regulator [Herbiconiux daphne]
MSDGRQFQRAYSAHAKAQRAADLLDAARRLGSRDGVRSLTLTAIAHEAGVHVSAVRRYYASREEILILLTTEGYQGWSDEVIHRLQGHLVKSAELVEVLVSTLENHPLFCDLLTHSTLSLEHEVSFEAVRGFKKSAHRNILDLTEAIVDATDMNSLSAGLVISATVALAATFWQAGHPSVHVIRLYQEEPNLAHIGVDFRSALSTQLTALIAGLACRTSDFS